MVGAEKGCICHSAVARASAPRLIRTPSALESTAAAGILEAALIYAAFSLRISFFGTFLVRTAGLLGLLASSTRTPTSPSSSIHGMAALAARCLGPHLLHSPAPLAPEILGLASEPGVPKPVGTAHVAPAFSAFRYSCTGGPTDGFGLKD